MTRLDRITSVLWATGYRWDYSSWIDLPVFDEFGYPVQQRGVTEHPGLYFLGLHYVHTLKPGLFLGVGEDAEHVASHIATRSGWVAAAAGQPLLVHAAPAHRRGLFSGVFFWRAGDVNWLVSPGAVPFRPRDLMDLIDDAGSFEYG